MDRERENEKRGETVFCSCTIKSGEKRLCDWQTTEELKHDNGLQVERSVLLWGFPMQADFLVSVGGCDIHNRVLDIKNKERIKLKTLLPPIDFFSC